MVCLSPVPVPHSLGRVGLEVSGSTQTHATYQIGIDMLELWRFMCLSVETSHIWKEMTTCAGVGGCTHDASNPYSSFMICLT